MERIILSNRMPKVEYFREYKGNYYFVQNGNLCYCSNGICHTLIPKHPSERCLGSTIDEKLYYFFEDEICCISDGSIETEKINLHEADSCCLYNGYLYWIGGRMLKRTLLTGGNCEDVLDINISSHATKIQAEDGYIIVSDANGFIYLIDWSNEGHIKQKIHADSLQDFLVYEKELITASRDKHIKKYEIGAKKLRLISTSEILPHFANCLVRIPSGYLIGLSNGQIAVLEANLNIICLKNVNRDAIRSIQCTEKGYITTSDDGCFYLVDKEIINGRVCRKLLYGSIQDKIQCSAFDGDTLYIGYLSGKIERIVKDAKLSDYSRTEVCRLKNIRSLAIAGKLVLAGLENGDIYDAKRKLRLAKDGGTPYSMTYADGKLFVGRRDGYLDMYEVGEGLKQLKHIHAHHSILGDILIRDDVVITCSDDQAICVWDQGLNLISSDRVSDKNTALNNVITSGKEMFLSSDNGCIYRMQGEEKQEIRLSRYPIRSLYWNENLFAGDRHGNIFILYKNGRIDTLYKGQARVVNIYPGESNGRIMVVFEDVVMTMGGEGMSKDRIFIIHGHNNELKKEVLLLLEKQNIEGIVLADKADKGRTIIDKLIEEATPAKFAVALLTPDDIVIDSSGTGKNYRARQNVVLEIGYFLGKLGKSRVIMLRMKDVEIPSDLQGILYKNVDDIENGIWKTELANELDEAGFSIDFRKLIKG